MGSTHNIPCSFSPFEESRLSLPTIVTLFPVITPLPLGRQRILALVGLLWKVWQVLGVTSSCLQEYHQHQKNEVGARNEAELTAAHFNAPCS